MHAEVVIAGAGVVGASIAWHLAQRGCRDVVVFDRHHELGGGSTSRATGGFRAQFDSAVNVALSLMAREKLRNFERELGVDAGYRPHGYLFLACSDAELSALEAAQRLQHACGLTEARMVSPREARHLSAVIEDGSVVGGAFCPTDGFIRPMNILHGYAGAARRAGVRFLFDSDFQQWRTSGRKVVAAQTSAGDIEGTTFVNALGAWAGGAVAPLRRNVAATADAGGLDESLPMTIWAGDWFHLRVRDGRILLLWPDTPADDATWLEELMRRARARVPRIAQLPIVEQWSGLYEMSPDEHAILGHSPAHDNLYLANGSSGHGVMHAPALGQLLAEMILDGRATSLDVAPLRPDRFA